MQTILKLEGEHVHLASQAEVAAGINTAMQVFARDNVDPLACAAASHKLAQDEPLTRDEALLSVIWDTADDKAFRAVTLGWLIRDIDIHLAVVLIEADADHSQVSALNFEKNSDGVPDEVILLPSMVGD